MAQNQNFTAAEIVNNIRELQEITNWFEDSGLFKKNDLPFYTAIKSAQLMLNSLILQNEKNSIPNNEDIHGGNDEDLDVRFCSVTGLIMTSGWCACDGDEYFKYEKDAIAWCLENGYKGIQEAFDDDAIYWTEWS